MEQLAWPLVVLTAVLIANHRLGQYLNPPLKKELAALKTEYVKAMKAISEVHNKVNAVMLDKGFK